jgi:hypothetical protein
VKTVAVNADVSVDLVRQMALAQPPAHLAGWYRDALLRMAWNITG